MEYNSMLLINVWAEICLLTLGLAPGNDNLHGR